MDFCCRASAALIQSSIKMCHKTVQQFTGCFYIPSRHFELLFPNCRAAFPCFEEHWVCFTVSLLLQWGNPQSWAATGARRPRETLRLMVSFSLPPNTLNRIPKYMGRILAGTEFHSNLPNTISSFWRSPCFLQNTVKCLEVTERVNLPGSPLTPPLYSFVLGEVTPSFKLPL